jgi:cell division cycle 14
MGDFNWITPSFVAFASPQHKPVAPIHPLSPEYAALPKTVAEVEQSDLPVPFKNVLSHFSERNVGLVVRLNSELYSPTFFTALGISHVDMIFEDGTCPALPSVRKFIKLAHDTIQKKKAIAVHCKAGLGRTGCLIGAYLIYRYGFTANDLIAFMRFMRPGMVVGPQQHWLHINQGKFREWWWEDQYKEKLALVMPTTPTKAARHRALTSGQTRTPPSGSGPSKRPALGEINHNEANGNLSTSTAMDECLPAPTPGQPRKTSRKSPHPRHQSGNFGIAADVAEQPPNEVVQVHSHRLSQGPGRDGETEEEWLLHTLSRRSSPMPADCGKKRAISYTTTTTTTHYVGDDDSEDMERVMSDVENWNPERRHSHAATGEDVKPKPKTPGRDKSGSGIGAGKVRSPRRSADSREAKAGGVRKASGRVGSVGAVAAGAGLARKL